MPLIPLLIKKQRSLNMMVEMTIDFFAYNLWHNLGYVNLNKNKFRNQECHTSSQRPNPPIQEHYVRDSSNASSDYSRIFQQWCSEAISRSSSEKSTCVPDSIPLHLSIVDSPPLHQLLKSQLHLHLKEQSQELCYHLHLQEQPYESWDRFCLEESLCRRASALPAY